MKLIHRLLREKINIDLIMIFVNEIKSLFLSIDFDDGHPFIHIFFDMLILWLSFEMKLLLFGNMSNLLGLITIHLNLKLSWLIILWVESIDQITDINFGFHCWLIINDIREYPNHLYFCSKLVQNSVYMFLWQFNVLCFELHTILLWSLNSSN